MLFEVFEELFFSVLGPGLACDDPSNLICCTGFRPDSYNCMHESACMVEKSNSGMIQSEIHLWKFILEFDTEFQNEFVLAS